MSICGGANEYHHRCQIQEVIPHTKLSYTWTHPSHSKGESVVSWFLKEADGVTEVILQHEGIENFADAGPDFARESYQVGWEELLLMLKVLLQCLEYVEARSSADIYSTC